MGVLLFLVNSLPFSAPVSPWWSGESLPVDSGGAALKFPPCWEFELEEGGFPVNVSKGKKTRQKLNDSHKPAVCRLLSKAFLSSFTPLIGCLRRVALCSQAANQGGGSSAWKRFSSTDNDCTRSFLFVSFIKVNQICFELCAHVGDFKIPLSFIDTLKRLLFHSRNQPRRKETQVKARSASRASQREKCKLPVQHLRVSK